MDSVRRDGGSRVPLVSERTGQPEPRHLFHRRRRGSIDADDHAGRRVDADRHRLCYPRPARCSPPPPDATIGRDAQRILDTIKQAGLERIDYLLITHFHSDHAGGVPEVAARIPIGTFIDYGDPLGFDRLTVGSFRAYEPVRAAAARHIVARAGDRLPLKGSRRMWSVPAAR